MSEPTPNGQKGRPPGLRRRAREAAMTLLYQADIGVPELPAHMQHHFQSWRLPPKAQAYAKLLVEGVLAEQQKIDEALSEVSAHWRLHRMNIIDRNILRMAIYEILHVPDVPRNVSINEGIELGKAFGTEESGSFINGILDRFHKPDSDEPPDEEPPDEEPPDEEPKDSAGEAA
jgi:transcription antitermination protein NusB